MLNIHALCIVIIFTQSKPVIYNASGNNTIVMNLDRDGPGPKERGLATAAAALQGQG